MLRRRFIAATSAMSLTACTSTVLGQTSPLRVGVIGHTGRGNYGHGLDTVWQQVPSTTIVAVADANPAGLAKAKQRLGVSDGFADYNKMLSELRPDIVAVCPRHPDQRQDMILSAIEHGARGLYVEKPFCRSPAEADEIVAACKSKNVKLAVAHRNRYHPILPTIDRMIADGDLGRLLEIRGRGKGDRRGGSEDLWVLGSHVLNLINYFGGAPKTCSATLLQDGRHVEQADVKPGNEAIGPLAGNELHARYEMTNGPTAYFDSVANDGTNNEGFGLQLIGSQARIVLQCDRVPIAHLIPGNPFRPMTDRPKCRPIVVDGMSPEKAKTMEHDVAHHLTAVSDLIDAVQNNRAPLCDVTQAATTVEMICAVFESHRQGGARLVCHCTSGRMRCRAFSTSRTDV